MSEGPIPQVSVLLIVEELGVSYVEIMDAWTIDEVQDALDYMSIRRDVEHLARES